MKDDVITSLVERTRAGDDAAFEELVGLYTDLVMGICYKMVKKRSIVEDLTQDIFLKAYRNLNSLKDPSRFRSWLARIAKNRCIDYMRTRKHESSVEQLQNDGFQPTEERERERPPSDIVASDEMYHEVVRAIEELSDIYHRPLMLKYLHNKTYEEIGELLDLPEQTVKTRLYRGRKKLKEKLADRFPDRFSCEEE